MTGRTLRQLALGTVVAVVLAGVTLPSIRAQSSTPRGEWRAFGSDSANTKYSPLDQITAENFTDLEIAWRWTSISTGVAAARPEI